MAATPSAASEPEGAPAVQKEAEKTIQPLRLPTPEEIRGQDIWNNCAVRSAVSGIMGNISFLPLSPSLSLSVHFPKHESFWVPFEGGGLGLLMGLFFGALDNPIMQEEMTARQQFVYTAKQMGRRSWSSAKTFAVMGLIFSGAECVVEKV